MQIATRDGGTGAFLVVQWLRLSASHSGGHRVDPLLGNWIPHAMWCCQKAFSFLSVEGWEHSFYNFIKHTIDLSHGIWKSEDSEYRIL